jgi:GT2 family glycosyltransferase
MAQPRIANLSAVIAAYTEERWDQLAATIQSLAQQSVSPRELILVIDHNARLLERVRVAYPRCIVISNTGERGTSGARNAGLAVATGELVVFFDDDVVVAFDWVERISADLADPRVLGAFGAIVPAWHQQRPRWFPEEFNWVIGCSHPGMPERKSPVRNLWGCCMCFRREVFDTVGTFRADLGRVGKHPIGCEETELCVRALRQWPDSIFMFDPTAAVTHSVPPSRGRWSYFRSRCFYEGRSKAVVVRIHGTSRGLASERAYASRVLPAGVLRGICDTLFHGDLAGVARGGAIMIGLWLTAMGYLTGRVFGTRLEATSGNPTVPAPAPGPGHNPVPEPAHMTCEQ